MSASGKSAHDDDIGEARRERWGEQEEEATKYSEGSSAFRLSNSSGLLNTERDREKEAREKGNVNNALIMRNREQPTNATFGGRTMRQRTASGATDWHRKEEIGGRKRRQQKQEILLDHITRLGHQTNKLSVALDSAASLLKPSIRSLIPTRSLMSGLECNEQLKPALALEFVCVGLKPTWKQKQWKQ